MTREWVVLLLIWITILLTTWIFLPRKRWAEAIFVFLMTGAFTWINVFIHLDLNLITFPVREFPKATDLSFTLDYFAYPVICTFYVLYEPNKHLSLRGLYLALWVSGLTLFDVVLERYTELIEYIHYAWYWTWIDFFILFLMIRLINKWFFRGIHYES